MVAILSESISTRTASALTPLVPDALADKDLTERFDAYTARLHLDNTKPARETDCIAGAANVNLRILCDLRASLRPLDVDRNMLMVLLGGGVHG